MQNIHGPWRPLIGIKIKSKAQSNSIDASTTEWNKFEALVRTELSVNMISKETCQKLGFEVPSSINHSENEPECPSAQIYLDIIFEYFPFALEKRKFAVMQNCSPQIILGYDAANPFQLMTFRDIVRILPPMD